MHSPRWIDSIGTQQWSQQITLSSLSDAAYFLKSSQQQQTQLFQETTEVGQDSIVECCQQSVERKQMSSHWLTMHDNLLQGCSHGCV